MVFSAGYKQDFKLGILKGQGDPNVWFTEHSRVLNTRLPTGMMVGDRFGGEVAKFKIDQLEWL